MLKTKIIKLYFFTSIAKGNNLAILNMYKHNMYIFNLHLNIKNNNT